MPRPPSCRPGAERWSPLSSPHRDQRYGQDWRGRTYTAGGHRSLSGISQALISVCRYPRVPPAWRAQVTRSPWRTEGLGRSLAMSAISLQEGSGSGKSVRGLLDDARTAEADDLIRSRSLVQQARVLARSNEDQPGEAEALYRLASVTYQLGQLDEAFGL